MDTISLIILIIGIFVSFRIISTRSRSLKLLYVCCLNFVIASLIVLYVKSPMGAIVAIVYFVFGTLSSNAIANTIGNLKKMER